jgi:hypothetical protein
VRVEGAELVHERDGEVRRTALSSLARAAELLGPELLTGGLTDDAEPLAIDPASAVRLADFYAFAADRLGELRASLSASEEPSAVILWPEHFDIAFEAGSEAEGRRANYGASPGDGDHPEPYLYVGPWAKVAASELWNARGFRGAELGYAELLVPGDPAAAASEFLAARHAVLAAR